MPIRMCEEDIAIRVVYSGIDGGCFMLNPTYEAIIIIAAIGSAFKFFSCCVTAHKDVCIAKIAQKNMNACGHKRSRRN